MLACLLMHVLRRTQHISTHCLTNAPQSTPSTVSRASSVSSGDDAKATKLFNHFAMVSLGKEKVSTVMLCLWWWYGKIVLKIFSRVPPVPPVPVGFFVFYDIFSCCIYFASTTTSTYFTSSSSSSLVQWMHCHPLEKHVNHHANDTLFNRLAHPFICCVIDSDLQPKPL